MNHEAYEELLALRLYDELDDHELRDLEAHLEGCSSCRKLSEELNRGLGAVPRSVEDLPDGWRENLEHRIRSTERGRRTPVLAFAAGLAAGILAVFFVPRGNGPNVEEPPRSAFVRATPPPPAAVRGPFVRLGNRQRNG